MSVTCKEKDRRLMAQLSGELDHHGAKAVMEELDRYIDEAMPRELILDLGGLTFTDSSGIAVLFQLPWAACQLTCYSVTATR